MSENHPEDPPRWTVKEHPTWEAPSAEFPYAVLEGERVIAWVRDEVDAAMIARGHNIWPEVGTAGLRVVADADQLRAGLERQQAELERVKALHADLAAKLTAAGVAEEILALLEKVIPPRP